ncbi:MAG: PAS domain S-box protein [Nitrospira sp.]|nr:PAS domain S-box protein [Nitrospira sp.]MCS6262413.1 PAS domain S-box protein [Nitrospira sp.]
MTAQDVTTALPPSGDSSTVEALVRTLSGQASIGIFLSDPEGRTLYLNERLRRIAGLPVTSTPGECWRNALAPEDHDPICSEWSGATSAERSFSREFRFRRPDGSLRWVMAEAFPLRTGEGPSGGYVGIVRDITPRQLALDALHANEERYRTLAQQSPHAILVYADNVVLFINEAGARLFGLTTAHPIEGRALWDCFPKEFLHDLPLAETTPVPPVERQLVRPDGMVIDVELTAAPVMFDGHPAIQILGTDITERKVIAGQLHRTKKMATVATLAGGIAHEFNNCLTAIMGFSDLALPSLVPDSRVHGHIQQVILASKRARDLVTQMLMVGRLADGAKQPLSLDILLKETLRGLKMKLPESISLREWIPGATNPVLADPTQIHELCLTLLARAQQVMTISGGVLEVRLDNMGLDASMTGHDLPLPPGQYVRLMISDTGDGIPPDIRTPNMYPLFAPPPTGSKAGAGLGELQRIVSEHGGTLRATSTAGQGTTIEVYLPAMLQPHQAVGQEPSRERATPLTEAKEFLAEHDKER